MNEQDRLARSRPCGSTSMNAMSTPSDEKCCSIGVISPERRIPAAYPIGGRRGRASTRHSSREPFAAPGPRIAFPARGNGEGHGGRAHDDGRRSPLHGGRSPVSPRPSPSAPGCYTRPCRESRLNKRPRARGRKRLASLRRQIGTTKAAIFSAPAKRRNAMRRLGPIGRGIAIATLMLLRRAAGGSHRSDRSGSRRNSV